MQMEYAGFVWSAFGLTGLIAIGLGLTLAGRLSAARRRHAAATRASGPQGVGTHRPASRMTVTESGAPPSVPEQ